MISPDSTIEIASVFAIGDVLQKPHLGGSCICGSTSIGVQILVPMFTLTTSLYEWQIICPCSMLC